MTESIVGRIDEMGSRIDDLERSVGELIQHAGTEADQYSTDNVDVNSLKIEANDPNILKSNQ